MYTLLKYTNKHTHNNAKQIRKTNGCTKKKKDKHTKEWAEKWMRRIETQKMKEEIDKSGKKRKVLLVEISIQNMWDFFFPLFSPFSSWFEEIVFW